MKTVRFALYAMMLSAFAACSSGGDEGSEPTPPQTDKSTVTFPINTDTAPVVAQTGGTSTLNFTATQSWTASVGAVARSVDWISVSPTSGAAGDVTLTITTQPNDTPDERNAAITIASGGQKKTVTVSQKQKDALTVTSNKVELKAEGGDFSIEAKANVSISYEIAEDAKAWLKPVSARGLTTTTFAFTADANDSTGKREGSIILKGDGLQEVVSVYQEGSQPTLVLTQDSYVVGADGDVLTVELKSNVAYELVLPDVDWLTEASSRAASAYTHRFEVAKNEDYDSRSAQIIFREKGGELADTVTVEQVQRDAIVLSASKIILVNNSEGEFSLSVATNVDFTVSTSADWITEVVSRGLVDKILKFHVTQNNDSTSREATITLTADKLKQKILVEQYGLLAEDKEVVKVEYRRSVLWLKHEFQEGRPYDTTPQPVVLRDRYYADGRMETDTITNGSVAAMSWGTGTKISEYPFVQRFEIAPEVQDSIFMDVIEEDDFECTSHSISKYYAVVPELSLVGLGEERWEYRDGWATPGNWEEYIEVCNCPNVYILPPVSPDLCTQDWESCDKERGWYNTTSWLRIGKSLTYNGWSFNDMTMTALLQDSYLSLDGHRIDFIDYLLQPKPTVTIEDMPESGQYGPGKKFIYECTDRWFDRDFYFGVEFTVYERKK